MTLMHTRKRFGQHFLEPAWVEKLVRVIAPHPDDILLEIGPGAGALTFPLAPCVARLVAIEVDRDLAAELRRRVPPNVEVVTGDILGADIRGLFPAAAGPIRVVGNLPYNISTPILTRLVGLADGGRFVSDATLMLQREVADRLAAPPGSGDYGPLGVLVQVHALIARALVLPPGAFRPAPKVTSAVVHLVFRDPPVRLADPTEFERMVRAIFTHRRKTLANALKAFADARGRSAAEAVAKAGLDPRRRPETLALSELSELADVFASGAPPDVL
jgi:16S rRNA (adenine1518-N6/adenine1519-N6)-dimethyltransferase